MADRVATAVAVRRYRRRRRALARRAELRTNLKALLIAAAIDTAMVVSFENAGRVFGISDRGLQSSLSGVINTGGRCDSVGDGRWLCLSGHVESSDGYGFGGGTYAVEETSRGCWAARYASHANAQRVFATFGSKQPEAEGCIDLADYFSGNDDTGRNAVDLGD